MRVVGIDLGTTSSAVATIVDGKPQVLADSSGRQLTPSVVHFAPDGRSVVGVAARNRLNLQPERTVAHFKRLIGLQFDSDDAGNLARQHGWRLARGADNNALIQLGEQAKSPVELMRALAQSVEEIAERAPGEGTVHAVVTVPATFSHPQRKALIEAIEPTGLKVERLLNEPTAAAIAYGLNDDRERTIAVFDLGGGTFDFTVLKSGKNKLEVVATAGDPVLGGSDIDRQIAESLSERLRLQHSLPVTQKAVPRLLPAAERIKVELSDRDVAAAEISARWIGVDSDDIYHLAVSRSEVESAAQPIIERSLGCVRRALADAALGVEEIDELVLVGGGTLMPIIKRRVEAYFNRPGLQTIDPVRVVAIGAALWAEALRPEFAESLASEPAPRLIERTAIGLGVRTIGGLVDYIIPPLATLPAERTRIFSTGADDQTRIRLRIVQGTGRRAEGCQSIGELIIDELPPGPRGHTNVAVTFQIDHNGVLAVSAIDSSTGARRETTLSVALED